MMNMNTGKENSTTASASQKEREYQQAVHEWNYGKPEAPEAPQPLHYDIRHVAFHNLLSVVMGIVSNQTGESFDAAMLRTKSADEVWRRHNALQAHADKLAEELRGLLKLVNHNEPAWNRAFDVLGNYEADQ